MEFNFVLSEGLRKSKNKKRRSKGLYARWNKTWYGNLFRTFFKYCNRRNFSMRFNFVPFVLLAESTKISSIRKPCTYTSECDTALKVRKFIEYESSPTLEYEIFTRTKISAITTAVYKSYEIKFPTKFFSFTLQSASVQGRKFQIQRNREDLIEKFIAN